MDFQWTFLEISDFPKKYFRKISKIFFLKNKFRSQKIKIFLWNFKLSHPMSRPSSSCIFGSIGPVEVFERGSYIVGILLCFLKKVGHTLLSRIISKNFHHLVSMKKSRFFSRIFFDVFWKFLHWFSMIFFDRRKNIFGNIFKKTVFGK